LVATREKNFPLGGVPIATCGEICHFLSDKLAAADLFQVLYIVLIATTIRVRIAQTPMNFLAFRFRGKVKLFLSFRFKVRFVPAKELLIGSLKLYQFERRPS
jgi:hypothetical protein